MATRALSDCISSLCNGSPGGNEVLVYQSPAQIVGTNNNHNLSHTLISVNKDITSFSNPNHKKKSVMNTLKFNYNTHTHHYKTSMKEQKKWEEVVLGDEEDVPTE